MKYNVEQVLGRAYCKAYFDDSDAQRVYEATLYKAAIRKNKRKHRLVPVLACALTALVLMTAVPPVRAAVVNFFESVGTYMSSGPEERPAVAGISVQEPETGEQKTEASVGAENWVDGIGVQIEEALFDGEKLYLNYTVSDPNKVLTPEKERCSVDQMEIGKTVHERLFGKTVLFENGVQMADGYDYRADYEDGVFHMTTMFVAENADQLKGRQEAVLKLHFMDQYVTAEAQHSGSVRADEAGSLSLPFAIEANTEMRTVSVAGSYPLRGTVIATHTEFPAEDGMPRLYSNKPVALDGTSLSFTDVKIKSTEVVLRMRISPSKEMSSDDASDVFLGLNYKVYADGVLMPDAYVDYTEIDEDGNSGETLFTIPFPPKEIRELKLVPCLSYTSSVDGKAAPENGAFDFPETSGSQHTEQLLEQSAITIDLSE